MASRLPVITAKREQLPDQGFQPLCLRDQARLGTVLRLSHLAKHQDAPRMALDTIRTRTGLALRESPELIHR